MLLFRKEGVLAAVCCFYFFTTSSCISIFEINIKEASTKNWLKKKGKQSYVVFQFGICLQKEAWPSEAETPVAVTEQREAAEQKRLEQRDSVEDQKLAADMNAAGAASQAAEAEAKQREAAISLYPFLHSSPPLTLPIA